ncbi:MAG TPA: AMP-binding protein, partial [Chloroflexota bacterium]
MTDHLYEIIRDRAARFPDAAAIGGQDGLAWRRLDGRALLAAVDAVADELRRRGVGQGDRVVLWLPNGWLAPVYYWACWKIGAVVVPFDRETNPEAAARIVAATEPRLVVLGYHDRPVWARGLASAVEWWTPGLDGVPAGDWQRPSEPLAALFFTSGTTGHPKGCEITHANLLSQLAVLGRHIPLGPGCRLASVLPLSHLLELTCGLLYPIAAGAAVHYAPSRRGPDVLRVLQEQRISHMIGVPQLLDLMGRAVEGRMRERMPGWAVRATLAASERLPLGARRWLPPIRAVHARLGGHLRMVASGGAALAPATRRLWERLGVRIVEGYGTSECSPVVACGAPDGSTPSGHVGRPIEGVEVRLGADGEILVRGPNVMRGYWRDSERTAEVLRDGWYHTGDLGALDAAGNLRVTGRARDLIVLPSGVNVWPADVEEVLRDDPAVRDAAVVAVPTASGGARLHAYLLPTAGQVVLGPPGGAREALVRGQARVRPGDDRAEGERLPGRQQVGVQP